MNKIYSAECCPRYQCNGNCHRVLFHFSTFYSIANFYRAGSLLVTDEVIHSKVMLLSIRITRLAVGMVQVKEDKGAVASWPNSAGSWCRKISEVGSSLATVESQPVSRSRLVNVLLRSTSPLPFTFITLGWLSLAWEDSRALF